MPPAGALLHLADHLDRATITTGAPAVAVQERTWTFAQPQPDWTLLSSAQNPRLAGITMTTLADGVRLQLAAPAQSRGPLLIGGIGVALEGTLTDWDTVLGRRAPRSVAAAVTAPTWATCSGRLFVSPGGEGFLPWFTPAPSRLRDPLRPSRQRKGR